MYIPLFHRACVLLYFIFYVDNFALFIIKYNICNIILLCMITSHIYTIVFLMAVRYDIIIFIILYIDDYITESE